MTVQRFLSSPYALLVAAPSLVGRAQCHSYTIWPLDPGLGHRRLADLLRRRARSAFTMANSASRSSRTQTGHALKVVDPGAARRVGSQDRGYAGSLPGKEGLAAVALPRQAGSCSPRHALLIASSGCSQGGYCPHAAMPSRRTATGRGTDTRPAVAKE